ncbi:MAG: hypothetical protein ACO2PN_24875 [Pyrobaculum sp.]
MGLCLLGLSLDRDFSGFPATCCCGGDVVAYLRVVDFIDVTGCEWFLEFGDGAWVRLDLSNAVVRLRDRFAVYVGSSGDRCTWWACVWGGVEGVGGLWSGRRFWRRLGWFLCLEA